MSETENITGFAEAYLKSGISRFHMPGHKGARLLGGEPYDLTEIKGADSLYESSGIIRQSELKTSSLFGSAMTCYSAEGSSLSIKAAFGILRQYFGRNITVAADRSCHGAFVSACALLGIDPVWIRTSEPKKTLCGGTASAQDVQKTLENTCADAVYITSPNYLGEISDIAAISEVCRKHNAFLVCDNAHGAYLKFTDAGYGVSHPLDLGADIVCDSAHKTLPVYTGGAYLHISSSAPEEFCELAKPSMLMFGSTSPSYLIMQSLDLCAGLLESGDLIKKIDSACAKVSEVKRLIKSAGLSEISDEPMKISLSPCGFGFSGNELSGLMRKNKMECEYSDAENVVLMLSPYNTEEDFLRLENFIASLRRKKPLLASAPEFSIPEKATPIREAVFSRCRRIPVDAAGGKICARPAMSCQPSVAAVMPGEIVSESIIGVLKAYGIDFVRVLE